MGPVKCPKMVVGATAKDMDMPESWADGEAEPARALRQGGRPGAHTPSRPCDQSSGTHSPLGADVKPADLDVGLGDEEQST